MNNNPFDFENEGVSPASEEVKESISESTPQEPEQVPAEDIPADFIEDADTLPIETQEPPAEEVFEPDTEETAQAETETSSEEEPEIIFYDTPVDNEQPKEPFVKAEKEEKSPYEEYLKQASQTAPAPQPAAAPYYQVNPQNTQPACYPVYYTYPPQGTAPTQAPPQGYYYMPYPPMQPPAEPPKKKKGATAFLVCMWVLIGIFALGFFGLCGYIIGNSVGDTDSTTPTFYDEDRNDSEKETKPATAPEDEDSDVVPLPDKDDLYSDNASIDLKSPPADTANTDKYTTQYAYNKVAESTVGIVCYEGGFSKSPSSQGTGIVLTKDGYIATNSHVIGDSRTLYYVEVIVGDGTTYEAKVIGYDSRTDLAVLKINADNLTPAEFCNSEYVEVGQDVIAVGNPGGIKFQNSLTRGVVSALNRELSLSSQVSYIQTDAAINPGNSGGPLCNMYGQVIGINTAKISSSSYEGMGFAIPSATVKEIVDDLVSQGYVNNRVRLGISGTEVSSAMQQYYGVPAGILVGEISEGGPCDGTDLKVNDIITKIDGEKVSTFSQLYGILEGHKPGDKLTLTVYRPDTDKTLEITVTVVADEGETQQ